MVERLPPYVPPEEGGDNKARAAIDDLSFLYRQQAERRQQAAAAVGVADAMVNDDDLRGAVRALAKAVRLLS